MRPWVSLHALAFLAARRLRPRAAREPAELCTPHLCVTALYAIARQGLRLLTPRPVDGSAACFVHLFVPPRRTALARRRPIWYASYSRLVTLQSAHHGGPKGKRSMVGSPPEKKQIPYPVPRPRLQYRDGCGQATGRPKLRRCNGNSHSRHRSLLALPLPHLSPWRLRNGAGLVTVALHLNMFGTGVAPVQYCVRERAD